MTIDPDKPWYPDSDPRWREHAPGSPNPTCENVEVHTLYPHERAARRIIVGFCPTREMSNDSEWDVVVAWRPV